MNIDIKAECGKIISLEIKEDDIKSLLSLVEKESSINKTKNYDDIFNLQKKLELLLLFNREPDEETCEKLSLLFADEYKDDLLPTDKIRISSLEFCTATFNCLNRAGIKFLDELLCMSEEDLLSIRNLGNKALQDIKDVLEKLGYCLAKYEK